MAPDAFRLDRPARQTTSVIFASPHSGRDYAPSFLRQSPLSALSLRSSEDAYVEKLFDCALTHGAPLIHALAPRAFIDLNRAPDELDPAVIEGVTRAPHNPRVSSGLGVIPRVVAGGRAIYRGRLARAEADARIARYWHPYHDALRRLMDDTSKAFGEAMLIDCHSMPHEAVEAALRPGQPRPDVVLGDRFGASSAAEVTDAVEAAFRAAGLNTARNTPFAGAYVAQSYGRPSRGHHVIQIEIDRALYMDEATLRPHRGYEPLRQLLAGIVADIAAFGRRRNLPLAAE